MGILAALPIQAALGTGQGFGAITQGGVLGEVLQEGVGLATFLGLRRPGAARARRDRGPLIGAGVLLAAGSFALSGHTRSTDNELLAVSARGRRTP